MWCEGCMCEGEEVHVWCEGVRGCMCEGVRGCM